jgi:F0F1-type ATP synthase assembly protein I
MPSDNNPSPVTPPSEQKVKEASNMTALAMELPFTLVGALALAVAIGYFLDRWLHTKPIFTLILGALGFIAGVREVIRRLPGSSDGSSTN